MNALLAFDTATEKMSIALARDDRIWTHDGAGGASASAGLIPAILSLLARAGTTLRDLDAIAFGRGPGAFTGLRTACSVAQGLALGAGKPVLPIDTLLAVAEDARVAADADPAAASELALWALMDARMDQIYAARYRFADGAWQTLVAPMLTDVDALNGHWRIEPPQHVAGNALAAFGPRLQVGNAVCSANAMPRARAMLPLARALWQRGGAVDAAAALPLYLRDRVAQTTAERDAVRAAKEATR
jgi:tRNA threonylcarbamoyladenosine biosynthesis protein TsaB